MPLQQDQNMSLHLETRNVQVSADLTILPEGDGDNIGNDGSFLMVSDL